MKCSICSLNIKIYEFDLGSAINTVSPITFRKANMHTDCYQDAIEIAEKTPSKKSGFASRYDEYITTKS